MQTLKRVTRIDSIPAGSTYFNEQGFLHDTPIVTSTGIFEYALPDGGVRRELRLPEHVFDKESLESYNGKPVIITHKAGSIDKNNVMKEIVGTIISEGYQDGSDVRCKIVIHDIDKVKKLPYRELSLGYNLDLIEEPGEWNGEPYDAIQTNIRINHLAIVESARAGDQAHLNLDGKKVELDDIENQEGGKEEMVENPIKNDSIDMTPEELIEAIKVYRASKPAQPAEAPTPVQPEAKDSEAVKAVEEPTVAEPVVEPVAEEQKTVADQEAPVEVPSEPVAPPVVEPVKEEAEKTDGDCSALIDAIIKVCEQFKANKPAEPVVADDCDTVPFAEESNDDSSEDLSQSMNNDSADNVFRQRLSICRIGDKLRMDGLENMSIVNAKKAIIAKVLPQMRLDGKNSMYIDAAYDLAVAEVDKRKDVNYQRTQMSAQAPVRNDGAETGTMAQNARQRMIEREGGNK